jgi:hypothetical protein
MDSYYDCPCGHRHSEHAWHVSVYGMRKGDGSCTADGCHCSFYHGHRVGDDPHPMISMGLRQPTEEMRRDGVQPRLHPTLS